MQSLWLHWPKIREALLERKGILLFDFDGTLAPIVSHPANARLSDEVRNILDCLASSHHVVVGIVSGRTIADLKTIVGLSNIHYIGSHGLESKEPGRRRRLSVSVARRRRVHRMANRLNRKLAAHSGVFLEKKVASIAIHYRNANRREADLAIAEVRREAAKNASWLKMLPGKKVVELLPAEAPNKGTSVHTLLKQLRGPRNIPAAFFGDDVSDESVFRSLRKSDFTVLVGRPRRSGARFFVSSPEQVRRFLVELCNTGLCK